MGTIAEKLTYLSGTKDLLKTTINYTGANITNDTFRSYPKKLKDAYIDIINNGTDTLYSNLPKVSEKGSNLSLTPTYEAPMRSELYGDTLQNGTPTPSSPIPIECVTGLQKVNVCGKNLFDKTAITQGYIGADGSITSSNSYVTTDYIPIDSTISYSKTTTNSPRIKLYDKNKNVLDTSSYSDISSFGSSGTYTIPSENAKYIRFTIRTDSQGVSVDDVMFVKGTTVPTTYEAYNGNTYEVNLGKNLINIPDGTYSNNDVTAVVNNGEITLNGTASATSFISIPFVFKFVENTDYMLSVNNSTGIGNNTYWAGLRFTYNNISSNPVMFTNANATKIYNFAETITTSELVIRTNKDIAYTDYVIKPQLEKGSQATSYSEYFTPIKLNKIDTYEDRIYKDNGKWYLEKNIGKVIIDGNNTPNQSGDIFFYAISNLGISYIKGGYCDYLKYNDDDRITDNASASSYLSDNQICFRMGNSKDRVYLKATQFNNNTELKNWLSTHNIELYYVLATPTTTEITNTELIEDLENLYNAKSKSGTTNISTESENLPVILSVSALKGE